MLPQAPHVQQIAVALDPELHLIGHEQFGRQEFDSDQGGRLYVFVPIDETLHEGDAGRSGAG